jgi:L-galactose dehydrogenase
VRIAEAVPVDTILSYCRYNLMVTDMDEILVPVVEKQRIGLINASPLHMGVLTEQGAPEWHPAPAEIREAGKKVAKLCRDRGSSVPELALRFCLDHPQVSATLVGMATRHHVEANLRLLQAITDPELLNEVRILLSPVINRTWPSERPENQDGIH